MKRGDTSPEKLSHKLLLSSMCRLKQQQQQQQQQQQEEDHEAVSGVHDELRAIYRQYVPNKTVCSKPEVKGREQQLLAEVQAKYIPSEGGGVEADYDVVGAVGAAGAAGAVESVDVVAGVVREE